MIDQKYWIDTDPFIDIAGLKAIESDIIKGICLTLPLHKIVTYGPITLDKPNFTMSSHSLAKTGHPYAELYQQLKNEITDEPQQREALKLFTKLTLGVYSGGHYIDLRHDQYYNKKNYAKYCQNTTASLKFPSLMAYIEKLPFTEIGRIIIFLNDHDLGTPIHTDDFPEPSHRNEFLWLNPNLNKKFFIYNRDTAEKHFVTSHSAFFNEQDWHGSDPCPTMNYSIRVDGFFTEEFREQLGISHLTNYNNFE